MQYGVFRNIVYNKVCTPSETTIFILFQMLATSFDLNWPLSGLIFTKT